MRDLLLRLGQAARDRLADVRQLDRLMRNRLLHWAGSDQVRAQRRRGSWGSSWRSCRSFADRGVDIGADNAPARAAAFKARQVDVLRLGESSCERRCLDAIAFLPRGCSGLRRCGRSFNRRLRRRPLRSRVGLRLRRGFWRRGGSGIGLGRSGRVNALAFAGHDRDRRADLHAVGAFRNKDFRDLALVDRFELHRRLVGLDLGEDVAGLHVVAFLDEPFGKRALLHRGGKRGHLEFDRHGVLS